MSKLDIKTKLFLYITHAKINKNHNIGSTVEANNKTKINEVLVFTNFEEYTNFFKQYLKDVDEELIKLAIYTTGKNGQIVALKKLCEHIIINQKLNEEADKEKVFEKIIID